MKFKIKTIYSLNAESKTPMEALEKITHLFKNKFPDLTIENIKISDGYQASYSKETKLHNVQVLSHIIYKESDDSFAARWEFQNKYSEFGMRVEEIIILK